MTAVRTLRAKNKEKRGGVVEEEEEVTLLQYEAACLIRAGKPHDAKEAFVETIVDVKKRQQEGKLDLKLLLLDAQHQAGETLEAITQLYLLLQEEEKKKKKMKMKMKGEEKESPETVDKVMESEWLITTQLVGYLVEKGEYESSIVLMERLIQVLGCQDLVETCMDSSDEKVEVEVDRVVNVLPAAARVERLVRTIVVLLHTARIQLRLGDPRASDCLVNVAHSMVTKYNKELNMKKSLHQVLLASVNVHNGLVLFSSGKEEQAQNIFRKVLNSIEDLLVPVTDQKGRRVSISGAVSSDDSDATATTGVTAVDRQLVSTPTSLLRNVAITAVNNLAVCKFHVVEIFSAVETLEKYVKVRNLFLFFIFPFLLSLSRLLFFGYVFEGAYSWMLLSWDDT